MSTTASSLPLLRRLLAVVAASLTLVPALHAAPNAGDAAFPTKPLRLIVPFPPGGAADAIGRTVARGLGERLGQPVTVENRPGAGTILAAQAAATAAPDGHTLSLATSGQLAINPALHDKLPYDPVKSFVPIGLVAQTAYVLAVPADSPIRSLQGLIDEARKRPGALAYSSCGNGTVCHLTGELLKSTSKTELLHVPFAGSAPAVTALLGHQVQVAADTVAVVTPHVQAGKLRALVTTDRKRASTLPDVPSAAEAGAPELISTSWFGVVAPAATPQPVVQRLQRELAAVIAQPATRDALQRLGLEVLGGSGDDFARQIDADIAKWGAVVRTANVRAE